MCRPALSRRKIKAICWSMFGCPIRPRWNDTQEVMKQIEQIAMGEQIERRTSTLSTAAEFTASRTRLPFPGNRLCKTRSAPITARSTSSSTNFDHRHGADMSADAIAAKLRAACYREVQEASVAVFGAPAVDGLGNAGGFKVMVRDVGDLGLDALQEAADDFAATGNEQPGLVGLYSAFRSQTPQMYVDVDRERCKAMAVPLNEVFLTLQLYLGGYYTNDFNQFGRTWQVNLQGDPAFSLDARAGAATESAKCGWKNGSAGKRGGNQTRRRPGAGDSLQRRYGGRRERRIAARRQLRNRHQYH